MQKFYNKIKKEGRVREHPIHGKTLADSMVRGVHMMLHEALDVAVRERLLVKNPTNGTTVPKCNYPEKQILGDDQLETFLKAIKGHEYWCDFFYVEVMTGLRRGEICGLKWQDISFEENKLQVKRSVSVKKGGGVSIGETKTETGVRSILMPPSVADVLQNRKQRAITEWVFPNFMHPEQPISPATAYRKLKIILKHAGLPLIRFHDLRHTFATMALENGMDIKTLSAIIGHISAETTLNIYSHITDTMQQQAAVRIDREIGGTDAQMPEPEPPKGSEQSTAQAPTEPKFEPYKGKIRKSGTWCVTMINDHLYEGRFTPRVNGKRISKNVYAKTREECEEKLAELIKTMKAEIAEMKKQAKTA